MDPATSPTNANALSDLVRRVQCEFLEMPGLRLTEPQVRRLSGLDPSYSAAVLNVLVEAGFLMRSPEGFFTRIDRAQPLRADLALLPARHIKTSAA